MVAAYGETEMIRLSTPEGVDLAGVVAPRVDAALAQASSLMDSYLGKRCTVPLSPVPAAAVSCCQALARYDMMFQGGREPTEQARLARKEWVGWLADVADGRVTLDGMRPPGDALVGGFSGARSQDRAPTFAAGRRIGW